MALSLTVEPRQSPTGASIQDSGDAAEDDDNFGLGVAQIVITAATPMMEEPEQPFPPPEETTPVVNHQNDVIEEEDEDDLEENEETSSANHREARNDCRNGTSKGCKEGKQAETLVDGGPDPEPIIEEPSESVVKKEDNRDYDVEVEEVDEPEPAADSGSGQFIISSSTGSDGETTGPSTAENSVSHAPPAVPTDPDTPKQVVGGRASIPDELEPHQLARLQDLKESNA